MGLTTLPNLCADCLEIWEHQPPGTLRAFLDLCKNCFTFHLYNVYVYIRCTWIVKGWTVRISNPSDDNIFQTVPLAQAAACTLWIVSVSWKPSNQDTALNTYSHLEPGYWKSSAVPLSCMIYYRVNIIFQFFAIAGC